MSKQETPEGWVYEAPDPSVGIFGEGWIHDACPAEDEHGNADLNMAECKPISEERIDDHTVRVTYRLTCIDCDAIAETTEDHWLPTEEVIQAQIAAEKDYWEIHDEGGL